MGDFNPLCTALYYVYFNLYYIWVIMGIYGFIWVGVSASLQKRLQKFWESKLPLFLYISKDIDSLNSFLT